MWGEQKRIFSEAEPRFFFLPLSLLDFPLPSNVTETSTGVISLSSNSESKIHPLIAWAFRSTIPTGSVKFLCFLFPTLYCFLVTLLACSVRGVRTKPVAMAIRSCTSWYQTGNTGTVFQVVIFFLFGKLYRFFSSQNLLRCILYSLPGH